MYLRRVRKTRKPITVCDRDDPVAQLVPLAEPGAAGELSPSDRERLQAQLENDGILVELPAASGSLSCMPPIRTRIAPDKRTDIHTIDLVRRGRDW